MGRKNFKESEKLVKMFAKVFLVLQSVNEENGAIYQPLSFTNALFKNVYVIMFYIRFIPVS